MTRTPIRMSAVVAVLAAAFAAGCGGSDGSGGGSDPVTMGTVAAPAPTPPCSSRWTRASSATRASSQAAALQHRRAVRRPARQPAASTRAPAGSPPASSTPSRSGVGIKMVAAKSRVGTPSYTSLLVSKHIVDSGDYKDFGDLKGSKVAIPSLGIPPHHELSLFLAQGGPVDQGRQDRADRLRRHGAALRTARSTRRSSSSRRPRRPCRPAARSGRGLRRGVPGRAERGDHCSTATASWTRSRRRPRS